MPAAGFGAWEPGAQVMSSECGGSHASHEDLRHSTGDRWIRLIHGRGSDIPHLEKKKKKLLRALIQVFVGEIALEGHIKFQK